jgi:hypothetical protein
VYRHTYECPAITELGTLHDRTLSWMAGADGGGFGGYLSKHNASVRKFGSFTIMGSDDDGGSGSSDDSVGQVKSSGSKSKHGGDSSSGGGGGGGKHGSSGHGGFNVSDVFKGFGGSH